MPDVVAHRPPTREDETTLRRLATLATAHDGHPPFGDSVWRDLAQPHDDSAVLLAMVGPEVWGAAHLAPPENASGAPEMLAAVVVDPAHRDGSVERSLLDAACEDVARRGPARLVLWDFGADSTSSRHVLDAGFAPLRELHQMRVALPVDEAPRWPAGVRLTPFRPGVDDDEWLVVNNRAFVDDPDQGGWTRETLAPRLVEPWFDPEGFLIARDVDGIAGFCWTKLHPATPPAEPAPLGEIYVIGVDPSRQGSGLGRALVLAGLDWLHGHGAPAGMLFVDAANSAAIGLYRSLGFALVRRDRAYSRDVA